MPVAIESGTANGIPFTSRCWSREWLSSFECRVHAVLCQKNRSGITIFLPSFDVDGTRWRLSFDSRGDGTLGVYLNSQVATQMSLHRTFTLVNLRDRSKNMSGGGRTTQNPGASQGYLNFARCEDILNPDLGFLDPRGFFVMRVDVRVISERNESLRCFVLDKMLWFEWKLKKVNGTSPTDLEAGQFPLRDAKWSVTLQPAGTSGKEEASQLLLCADSESEQRVEFEIVAMNANTAENNLHCKGRHVFQSGKSWSDSRVPTIQGVPRSEADQSTLTGVLATILILDGAEVRKMAEIVAHPRMPLGALEQQILEMPPAQNGRTRLFCLDDSEGERRCRVGPYIDELRHLDIVIGDLRENEDDEGMGSVFFAVEHAEKSELASSS